MKNCPNCHLAIDERIKNCPRCGEQLDRDPVPLLVDSRYVIESELGHGAMGVVYLARDTGLNRRVALKFVASRFATDPKIVERFKREAGALAAIRNDHVVQVHSFGRYEETYFFAMEYIQGQNLDAIIVSHATHSTPVPAALGLSILWKVARGLEAIHDAGLLHRDVKPTNIAIEDRTGRPVLLDLGLVKPLAPSEVRQTDVVGSPPYMAPEQIMPSRSSASLTPAVDVYGLGCTAYELFTGKLPFEGRSAYETMHLHLTAPPPKLSSTRPELADLDGVLTRALAKSPAARFSTAAAFAAEFEAALQRREQQRQIDIAETLSATRGSGQVRVLIVDDDSQVRGALARLIKSAMHDRSIEVVLAESGMDAIARVREAPPSVLILDYEMPDMNGVETLALLRAQPGAAMMPAIVMTGFGTEDVRWRFGVLGVTEFLRKPDDLSAIGSAIRRSVMSS